MWKLPEALVVMSDPAKFDEAWRPRLNLHVEKPHPEAQLEAAETLLDVRAALHTLPFKQQAVLLLRFGILDGQEMTLEEIGQVFGCTREYIRQLQVSGLKRLRKGAQNRRLHASWCDSPGRPVREEDCPTLFVWSSARTAPIPCAECARSAIPVEGTHLCPPCFHDLYAVKESACDEKYLVDHKRSRSQRIA